MAVYMVFSWIDNGMIGLAIQGSHRVNGSTE